MLVNRLNTFYSKLKIRKKITIPFVASFLLLWLSGTSLLGYLFVRKLQGEQATNTKELARLVAAGFENEALRLQQKAQLLADRPALKLATARQERDVLRGEVDPVLKIQKEDWAGIFENDRQILLDLRQADLENTGLNFSSAVRQGLEGESGATLVTARTQNKSLLVGVSPITNSRGVIATILVGRQLSSTLLSKMAGRLNGELIALSDDAIIAHSFQVLPDIDVQALQDQGGGVIQIGDQQYSLASVPLQGLIGEEVTILVLGDRSNFERAIWTLWVAVGMVGFGGAAISIVVGYGVGRYIAQPIQTLADAADEVSQQANFQVSVPVTSADELGTLARSLNQLIEWSGLYTQKLETMNELLEQNVKERTQDLESALQNLQSAQLQLIQTEKMSSLGQMVAGIAHEINNPINFIKGNLSYLDEYFKDLCELVERYQEICEPNPDIENAIEDIDLAFLLEDTRKILGSLNLGTSRVQDIVVAMRNFSRLDEAEIKAVDIHEGLESTLLILNNRLKYDIEVVKNYGDLPHVECYPAQLNQVFSNIIVNAVDAMEEGDCDPKKIEIITQAVSGKEVRISFLDTGPGISDAVKDKIFDPFFTTKQIGKGTGLGLGICYQVIQKHKGSIEVSSQLGKGTEFIVKLPINLSMIC